MKLFTLTNFATGKTRKKIQKTAPKMDGFTVVSSERVLPDADSTGRRLFRDAANRPYYSEVGADGSHRQP